MNDDTPTTGRPQEDDRPHGEEPVRREGPQAPRLRRSSTDRVLAGVAGGLGRYFGVDPVIFRIGFALSVFFGGLGALAYLLLAVFVPTDGDPDKAERVGGRLRTMGFWRALGLIAIAALALMGLLALAGGAAFAVALGWGIPIAIVIIAIGGLLALAALRGGARWLIPPAVALAVGAGVAAASDLDFRGGIGEREYHPLSTKSIPADGYRLGVGRLVVDLRDLNWGRKRVVPLSISLGAGQADVFVPERVCVAGSTHAGVGESEVAGERSDGFDVDQSAGAGSGAVPRLEIDADLDMGQLRVINSDTADVDNPGYGPGPFHEDTAPLRAAEARACAAG
ncbi:MAG TPA: PspC domain-containing protein [Solirubrobacterales bacterium]|jgi:phage shock protein PspC (stress-responsive transcriptional regulator)|nr:PspC domain-containing protein [Solirubrobacterales bacterium]